MKQQNEENTELYRRLRGSFEMSPEQMQRVRQEIQQRTGGENAVSAAITQHRAFSGRTLAKRLIPAAACLLLAVGGGIFLHFRSAELTDSFTQQSSVMMDEVTAVMTETTTTAGQTTTRQTTTRQTTTLTMTTTQTTEQTRMQTTELTTGQMTEQFTDIETEAVQTEMNDVTQLQYETESVTDAQETTSVSVSTTVTAITTTTTQTVTTELTTEIISEKYEFLVQSVTGSPGDIVEIGIVIPQEIAFAGFQMCVLMPCDLDRPIVCTEIDPISDNLLCYAQDQGIGMSCNFAFVQGQNIELPAGSTLLTLKCRIPSHAEPGSIFTIDIESAKFVTEDIEELPLELGTGSITVI